MLKHTEQTADRENRLVFNREQAARFIGCTTRHLDNLCKSGMLKSSKLGKRRVFLRDTILEMIKNVEE